MSGRRPGLAAAMLAAGLAVALAVHGLGERTGSTWALVDDLVAGAVLGLVVWTGASVLRRRRRSPEGADADAG